MTRGHQPKAPPAAAAPRFVLYVRAVEGRLVPRWGSQGYIGARRMRLTDEERRAGAATIVWDTERVVGVTEAQHRTYRREFLKALRTGDLERVDEAEYKKWLELEQQREAKRIKELEAAAKAPKPTADQTKQDAEGKGSEPEVTA